MQYRVETLSYGYDPRSGWVGPECWSDRGVGFASPYGALMYGRGLGQLFRIVDEELDGAPASSGVVSWTNWVLKAEYVKGNPTVVEVPMTDGRHRWKYGR